LIENLQLEFAKIIKEIPQKPGVYRFYGQENNLLYIGKAKSLKNRVSSYFQKSRPRNERLTLMISQIVKIEYTVVNSEKESLLLEANLIHELQPKYNILLKDDKSYLYVRITNDIIPGIFLTRRKIDPKSKYFGPYTKKYGIYSVLQTLRTIFPFCQERFPQKRSCNYVSIRQCDGICVGKETKMSYLEKIHQIENILKGKIDLVEIFIKTKIKESLEQNNFQLAALWRDKLNILKETIADQKIVLPHPQDIDILTLITENSEEGLQIGSIFIQNIRAGKIVNVNNFLLSGIEDQENFQFEQTPQNEPKENFISNNFDLDLQSYSNVSFNFLQRFLTSYYAKQSDLAPIILQSFCLES
jgi:excinuclease ABC subunit C